jgi:arsenate reductase (glutaredoxin)
MITIYGIPNCDTIKKTLVYFETHHKTIQFHNYKKDGVPEALLLTLKDNFTPNQYINSKGSTYKKLTDAQKEKITKGDDKFIKSIINEQPSIIKRPIVVHGKTILIGYDEAAWEHLI